MAVKVTANKVRKMKRGRFENQLPLTGFFCTSDLPKIKIIRYKMQVRNRSNYVYLNFLILASNKLKHRFPKPLVVRRRVAFHIVMSYGKPMNPDLQLKLKINHNYIYIIIS